MDFGVMRIHRTAKAPKYVWHGQPGLHQATVFKAEKHVKFPYDLGYQVCGDYDAITRMAYAGLTMRSVPVLLSINDFNATALSGRKKVRLIMEAVRAQRKNLQLSSLKISVSVLRRIISEVCAKVLTWVEVQRGKIAVKNGVE